MFYTPQLLEEIQARLPTSTIVGRRVQLKKRGREWVGLSPFTQEKTPSFTVNDLKGFYHCFSTSKHGNIFNFLMETEGLSFVEAVEKLANEAGVALPKPERPAQQKQIYDQQQRLFAACEAACILFEQNLTKNHAIHARDYMEKRGLLGKASKEFRIGYAINERYSLRDALTNQGFSKEELILAGLLIHGDDIPIPYDRFRDRIMFPIQDAKGRVIAFGGRAMAPDAQAKYLNSPETPLFHKGSTVYNLHRARKASHEADKILICEGYVDVIALTMHGFPYAVAPLGTALTEDQMGLIWRLVRTPTLCFDGDKAGVKAAYRALETALPHLEPGKSLNFVFLPNGQDPDDVVRMGGAQAMHSILAQQEPLIQVLWRRETSSFSFDTPESRALLEQNVKKLTQSIKHPDVARHYSLELEKNMAALLGTTQKEQIKHQSHQIKSYKYKQPATYRPIKQQALVKKNKQRAVEAGLIMGVVAFPQFLHTHLEDFLDMPVFEPNLLKLRQVLVDIISNQPVITNEQILVAIDVAGATDLLRFANTIVHRELTFINPNTDVTNARLAWENALNMVCKLSQLEQSLKIAEQEFIEYETEDNWQKLSALRQKVLNFNENN